MLSLISAAFAPGIAILSYVYLRDKYELEPLKLIIKMFILGSILVLPSYVFERAFQEGLSNVIVNLDIYSSAVIEEFFKWFTVYFLIYKHVEFNEPYDGIVYAVTVSIGFASIENLFYLFFHSLNPSLILLRGLLPVSSHGLFAITMGYFIGIAKFSKQNHRHSLLFLSLFIPVLAHALYNFILTQQYMNWVYLMIPFIILFWIYGLRKIKAANKLSPFKERLE